MSRLFHPLLTPIAASTDRALLPAMVAPLSQLVFDDRRDLDCVEYKRVQAQEVT